MSEIVAVDTNLWEYAYTRPRDEAGTLVHDQAATFIDSVLAGRSVVVALSSFQLAELIEVLRRVGASREVREELLDLALTRCVVVPVGTSTVVEAVHLSTASGIHVWDYLVALPLRGIVSVIYTADKHFQHPDFGRLATITNPLSWEMVEGQGPSPIAG